jgi:quercetin dioxygenase-like cupin family protein
VSEGPGIAVVDLARIGGAGGVVWSVSPGGFHTNLVVLAAGGAIPAHRNDALDVLVVVLDGTGTATVDDATVDLHPATAVLVRRGSTRAIAAGNGGLRYLAVHAERPPLGIGERRSRVE